MEKDFNEFAQMFINKYDLKKLIKESLNKFSDDNGSISSTGTSEALTIATVTLMFDVLKSYHEWIYSSGQQD